MTPKPPAAGPTHLSQAEAETAVFGGKASALVRLVAAGFRVPEAVILPAGWFAPWWADLEGTAAWAKFQASGGRHDVGRCVALQEAARGLAYAPAMAADLDSVRRTVASWGGGATCAVRSSSPDEDLEGTSFAGGYVSVLGVPPEELEGAVRDCFVSCLDERVALYKREHGLDALRPRIAVLVQRQLASDVAGVGFSLNPITNDFDEAVIEANFGLGETVVAGEVSPDRFIVAKPGRTILERRLGSKGVSRRLRPGGGVERHDVERADEASLQDEQVLELVDTMGQVEELFGHPVDIEWAYTDGELHLLQARPMTTYFPLADELLTEPGAPRRLYWDANLSEKITINGPISALTLDAGDALCGEMCRKIGIPYGGNEDPQDDLLIFAGSRAYVDFGKAFWGADPARQAQQWRLRNVLLGRVLENLDVAPYTPSTKPKSKSLGRGMRRTVGMLRAGMWRSVPAFFSVARFRRHCRAAGERFERAVASTPPEAPIAELLALNSDLVRVLLGADLPTISPLMTAIYILEGMRRDADAATLELLDAMNRGYPDEIVTEMGADMFALSRLLDAEEFDDLEELERKVVSRALPDAFLDAWDAFQSRYGARGPLEADLRNPRYGDSPGLLLRQISFMAKARPEDDPGLAHRANLRERREALDQLLHASGRFRRAMLRRADRWIDAYGGARDMLKHHWMLLTALLRRAALVRGADLAASGRLDHPDDVFHLTWAELAGAESDPDLDVRGLARERGDRLRWLEAHVEEFPQLVDSRGRILRAAPAPEGGDIVGVGISPGVARGPVKVLHDPFEKEVLPGDVLFAYTTDPGWTPLFVNAAAIVLEIGGVTQHGGIVAREYRKPCIAGIEGALTLFEDGQIVEVDANAGIVRRVDQERV